MAISPLLLQRLQETMKRQPAAPRLKRGADIFAGTDYPQRWKDFVGQAGVKEQLQVQVASATARGVRIEHTLLASGHHGIGKTSMAMILAMEAGAGLVQTSGPLTADDAREMMLGMQDGDILFWDEFHLAVTGNRHRADWLLPFLTDGELFTRTGAQMMPDIAIVAATTDVGRLPQTIISRFMVRPKIVPYTDDEAAEIARRLSGRIGVYVPEKDLQRIARAANGNPRDMRMILTALRDLVQAHPETAEAPDLEKAFDWAGLTYDGLGTPAQDMMLVLLAAKGHTASIESLQAQLNEPGPLRHHEQNLLQRGYLTITGRGRVLTDDGVRRALKLVEERR